MLTTNEHEKYQWQEALAKGLKSGDYSRAQVRLSAVKYRLDFGAILTLSHDFKKNQPSD